MQGKAGVGNRPRDPASPDGERTGKRVATWSEMGGSAKAAVVLLGIAAVGLVGVLVLRKDQGAGPEATPVAAAANLAAEPVATAAPAAAAPEPAQAAAPAAEEAPKPPEASETAPVLPEVATWRVAPDGSAVVAGTAPAGSKVLISVDGVEVTQADVGAGGEFAALFTLAPNAAASLMTLDALLEDGQKLAFAQSIALAPIAGPEAADTPPETSAAGVMITENGVEVQPAPEVVAEVAPDAASEPVAEAPVADAAAEPEAEAKAQAAIAPVAEVVIDAISYDPAGQVILSGRGEAGQTVRAYLDNAFVQEAASADTGRWNMLLTDVAPGIYTLRLDQVAADGAVTARFETPFKRETPEALAALTAPAAAPAAEAVPTTPEVAAAPEPVAEAVETVVVAEAATTEAAPSDAPVVAVAPETTAPEITALETPAPETAAPEASAPATVLAETEVAPVAEGVAPVTPEVVAVAEPVATAVVAADPPVAAAPETPLQPAAETAPQTPPQMVSITVQPGYSLWKIARDTYGEGVLYVQVYEANRERIRDPDLIYPGQIFLLPAQ